MSKSIIKVQFADRYREGEFGKQEYTYYLDEGLTVSKGDIITVPTKFWHTRARVSQINLSDGVIDVCFADSMKTITAADLDTAPRPEPPYKPKDQTLLDDMFDSFFKPVKP